MIILTNNVNLDSDNVQAQSVTAKEIIHKYD